MNVENAETLLESPEQTDSNLLVPVIVNGKSGWQRKPTKREMEAAALESTALATEGAILIQQLTSVVNQLLTERKQMDAAVDGIIDALCIDESFTNAIYELRKMRLEE